MGAGVLFVVATPIGNLGDITLRAIETLRSADRVVAEDTRRTRALLSHLGIAGKPVVRLDAHAAAVDLERVVAAIASGERVALVTDAGTPVVSDPGTALVRAAAHAGIAVIATPGPSAVVAALSVSGLVTGGFRFVGFLPRTGRERKRVLALVLSTPEAVVLFEAPQRLAGTLAELARSMPHREAVVARELTKVHEELLRGTLEELARAAAARDFLGEVTLVLGPMDAGDRAGPTDEELDRRIDEELAQGKRPREIVEALAIEANRSRRAIYDRVLARRNAR